jgi:hypothetical protein
MSVHKTTTEASRPLRVEILAYAPTEFFHCQHCELVWNQVGLGARVHQEQRRSGLLPADLEAEYAAVSDWAYDAAGRYGDRLSIKVVDAASLEGVVKALRHRVRRFPAFVVGGQKLAAGFDRERLDAALAERLETGAAPAPAPERR